LNRRDASTGLTALTAGSLAVRASAQTPASSAAKPIVLHCDLKVDPEREEEMLIHFHRVFKPAGAKFSGFIDVKMLKLRTLIQGEPVPAGVNFRFQLTYENEALRQIWVNSDVHRQVWAGIEATLIDKNFQVVLFDDA
jgi:hypothetical protein